MPDTTCSRIPACVTLASPGAQRDGWPLFRGSLGGERSVGVKGGGRSASSSHSECLPAGNHGARSVREALRAAKLHLPGVFPPVGGSVIALLTPGYLQLRN